MKLCKCVCLKDEDLEEVSVYLILVIVLLSHLTGSKRAQKYETTQKR